MCSAAKHVPEVAKGFHDTREYKELPARVSEIKKHLQNARQSLEDNKNAVDKSGDDCLQQLKSLRDTLNTIIDRLEKRTVTEIEKGKSSVGVKIQTDVDKIDDVIERLQKLSDELNAAGENNEATSYIGCIKVDDVIWKAKVLLHEINSKDNYKMSFQPFTGITEYLSSRDVLGEVICEGGEKPLPGLYRLFKVVKHVLHNVKLVDDKDNCYIHAICRLASGEFLLADNFNSKLKLLDSSYKVISTCDVSQYLQSVCLTGEREAAAAVNNNEEDRQEIHLFRVRLGRLLKSRIVKLQHDCIGIAHHSGDLYIATGFSLHVYNILGDQSRELYSDQTGEYTVCGCTVSPDGSRVFITNNTHHQLITLNKNGTKLSTLTHPELKNPIAVHVTSIGHVFVSCGRLGTVVQVVGMKDGKQTVKPLAGKRERLKEPITVFVQPLAGKREGLNRPTSVFYNISNNTLVVGQDENDDIVELQLKP